MIIVMMIMKMVTMRRRRRRKRTQMRTRDFPYCSGKSLLLSYPSYSDGESGPGLRAARQAQWPCSGPTLSYPLSWFQTPQGFHVLKKFSFIHTVEG